MVIYLKATGVVRRIDDLGRIVIPKEMRRTLRIREGEALEIFVDNDFVALKKYSPMTDLEDFAKVLVDSVYGSMGSNILVTDRDKYIAVAGALKKKYLHKSISSLLESLIDKRAIAIEKDVEELELSPGEIEKGSYTIHPIIMNGDAIGLVIIFSLDKIITDTEVKISQIVSQILGKHIEE